MAWCTMKKYDEIIGGLAKTHLKYDLSSQNIFFSSLTVKDNTDMFKVPKQDYVKIIDDGLRAYEREV